MLVRSIPAVVTTVIRPVKPGSRLVRSSTLTPQTSSLDAGKRDFSVSFSWLCSLPLFVFCLQHCFFFFALTIFFSTTTLKHKNILSGILLIFYYVLMFFFSAFVVKFSTCFPSFLYQFSCDLFLVIAICFSFVSFPYYLQKAIRQFSLLHRMELNSFFF